VFPSISLSEPFAISVSVNASIRTNNHICVSVCHSRNPSTYLCFRLSLSEPFNISVFPSVSFGTLRHICVSVHVSFGTVLHICIRPHRSRENLSKNKMAVVSISNVGATNVFRNVGYSKYRTVMICVWGI
jgi:hypothetical protein